MVGKNSVRNNKWKLKVRKFNYSARKRSHIFKSMKKNTEILYIVVVVVLLFFVHGKHLRTCRDGQLT